MGASPTVIRISSLRWYVYVIRKNCMKKCMEIRLEDRRTVERPRKTLVENVEVDIERSHP